MLSDKQKKHILVNRDGLKYYTVEGLEKVHEEMLRLLLIIDTIAKENNIPYWIDGGSLIGIVRHKGFIPWDDDLDISLLKKDYLRLIKEGNYILLCTISKTIKGHMIMYPFIIQSFFSFFFPSLLF